jgi:hypothetical protein
MVPGTLTLSLDGGKWSALGLCRFALGEALVLTQYEVLWAPEPVWTLQRKVPQLSYSPQPVAIPTGSKLSLSLSLFHAHYTYTVLVSGLRN